MTGPAAPRFRIVLVGVGGQGCVTAGRVLGDAALAAGLETRVGELHGMSQRGGSVQSTVVVGRGRTAVVERGGADVVVGLEPLEAQRAMPFASAATHVLVNETRIVPPLLAQIGRAYPPLASIRAAIREVTERLTVVDGTALAHEAGEARSLNVVMLGALAGLDLLPFDAERLRAAVEARSPARFLPSNRRAYALGLAAMVRQRTA